MKNEDKKILPAGMFYPNENCMCGNKTGGKIECELCGAYICKDCSILLGQCVAGRHVDVDICEECDEEMMRD